MGYLANADRPRFADFNRASFTFDHTLHSSPYFELENLVEVSKRLPTSYYSTDPAGVDAGWHDAVRKLTLPETMAGMAESQSLVLLKGLAEDAEYAPIFRDIIADLEEMVGAELRSDADVWRATVIVGSPGRVTPYHIDGEANFLFQLRGEKTMSVFDPTNQTVLTDVELENFYAGDFSAAKYKPQVQDDAFSFAFPPGRAVHVPLHAPHWVKNGDAVSIALSVNCTLHSKAHLAQLYRFNRLMRKSGIAPASPGISLWQDRIKLAAIGGIGLARRAARPGSTNRHTGR